MQLEYPGKVHRGQEPKTGWVVPYLYDGDTFDFWILFVGDKSPDGKRVNVAGILARPPRNGKPGGFDYRGAQYDVAAGQIMGEDPCGPPWG